MTTGERLVSISTLPTGTAMDLFLNIKTIFKVLGKYLVSYIITPTNKGVKYLKPTKQKIRYFDTPRIKINYIDEVYVFKTSYIEDSKVYKIKYISE